MQNNNIQSDLICPSCSSYYDYKDHIPRMLAECGHTYCSTCIQNFIKDLPQDGTFVCLEDKVPCQRKESVHSFPQNFALIRLMEQVKLIMKHQDEEEGSGRKKIMSSNTSSSSHNKENFNSPSNGPTGEPSPFQAGDTSNYLHCKDHNQKMDIICLQCQVTLCAICALFGGHKNHNVKTQQDVMKDLQLRAEKLVDILEVIQAQSVQLKSCTQPDYLNQRLKCYQNTIIEDIKKQFTHLKLNFLTNLKKQELRLKIDSQEQKLLEEVENKTFNFNDILKNEIQIQSNEALKQTQNWINLANQQMKSLVDAINKQQLTVDFMDTQNNNNNVFILGQSVNNGLDMNINQIEKKIKNIQNENLNLMIPNQIYSLMDQIVMVSNSQRMNNISNDLDTNKSNSKHQRINSNPQNNSMNPFQQTRENLRASRKQYRNSINIDKLNTSNDEFLITNLSMSEIVDNTNNDSLLLKSFQYPPQGNTNTNNSPNRNEYGMQQQQDINSKETTDESLLLKNDSNIYKSDLYQNNHKSTDPNNYPQFLLEEDKLNSSKMIDREPLKNILEDTFQEEENTTPREIPVIKQIDHQSQVLLEAMESDSIESADFSHGEITELKLAYIISAIRKTKNLRTLKFNYNVLKDETVFLLIDPIMDSRSIQNIFFTQNIISDQILDKLLEIGSKNLEYKSIHLDKNNIDKQDSLVRKQISELKQLKINIII